ncbi:MAG: triose-phosphate isomerase, partial [Nitrospinaceae bacterium]|nr:triosephosphate isomerase [Nitrospinaceae bacterium]NIR56027.1 triosephosphate isomerase [Nitrospinaceae bacterium]NIS86471.1 triosephosphate isomerase [Nitrospinaceae bacterium]NIT83306.1 triosephosphate isomerase [Nitrospinaceae bacterium]NIU45516.1 triosephosphate isomerase [Nitrospinaceae bacterium]
DGVTEMEIRKTVVAYEPVWAIGTGKNAEPGQAQEIHEFIRSQIGTLFNPEIAQRLRIIYGGSVNPANSENLLSEADIDG